MTDKQETFEYSAENQALVAKHLKKYPADRKASAVLPLLDLAQRQCGGWLPRAAMDHVATLLEMAPIRVYEVVSFYEMYHDAPRGKHELRVCTTTPCWLRGSSKILSACEKELKCSVGEISGDGLFSLSEFECLGACVNAPIVWIDDDYFEDVDPASVRQIIETFRKGQRAEAGTVIDRQKSAPRGGLTSLITSGEQ